MRFRFETTVSFFPTVMSLLLGLLFCVAADAQCNLSQVSKLLADDGAAGDSFGWDVAISGNTGIIGAPEDDDNGVWSGSAYLFDVTTGQQLFKLLPNDGAAEDYFGYSVGIEGTIAIVGAWYDDDHGPFSGSAYLFDTTTGTQIAKLLPNDGASGDLFGSSVAISGTTAIIGANGDDDNGENSGSAYLFNTTTGQQIAKLLPADGAAEDYFGARNCVAIDGNIAIVGAEFNDDNGENSGSAYLFNTTTGQQLFKLLPDDGEVGDLFGRCSLSGTTAIVGARDDDDNGVNSGSAYLFDTATGQQICKLLPNDGAALDHFGVDVAIKGTIAVVGAWFHDGNGVRDAGAAYVFDAVSGQQLAKLLPDDGAENDFFGRDVGISGSIAIVTAINDDDNGPQSGSAYLFDVSTFCPVCAGSGLLIEGTGETGDFNATCGSDDSYWSAHGATFAFRIADPVVQFELTATAPAGFGGSTISVDIEASKASGNANLNLRALLFNYTSGAYVALPGIMGLNTTDAIRTFNLPVGADPADFIEPGTNNVRLLLLTIQTSGLPNVRTRLDEVLFHFE